MEKILDTDLQHYRFLSALELLPGGKQAVLVCSMADMEQNNYRSDLHLLDVATGKTESADHPGRRPQLCALWQPVRDLSGHPGRGGPAKDRPGRSADGLLPDPL